MEGFLRSIQQAAGRPYALAAYAIAAVLFLHGWDAGFAFAALTPFTGLTIIARDARFPEAVLLQQALRAIGVEAGGGLDPSMSPDQIILRVGSKP